jgi:protein-tyrosine phosphatase
MAECLMAARLGRASGWTVASAGLGAMRAIPATDTAVEAMHELGLDLGRHRSQPVTRELVDAASVIVVMTRSHREQIRMLFPEAKEKTFLLRSFDPKSDTRDVEDPIGSSLETYRHVRDQIDSALPELESFMTNLDVR